MSVYNEWELFSSNLLQLSELETDICTNTLEREAVLLKPFATEFFGGSALCALSSDNKRFFKYFCGYERDFYQASYIGTPSESYGWRLYYELPSVGKRESLAYAILKPTQLQSSLPFLCYLENLDVLVLRYIMPQKLLGPDIFSSEFVSQKLRSLFFQMLLWDFWLANPDRNESNILFDGKQFWFVDFGHVFCYAVDPLYWDMSMGAFLERLASLQQQNMFFPPLVSFDEPHPRALTVFGEFLPLFVVEALNLRLELTYQTLAKWQQDEKGLTTWDDLRRFFREIVHKEYSYAST